MGHDRKRFRRPHRQFIGAAVLVGLIVPGAHVLAQSSPDAASQDACARQSLVDSDVSEAINAFPDVDREGVQAWIAREEFAMRRFLLVLEASPEQAHAMREYRRRSLAEHLADLSPLYHEFEEAQEEFQRRVHEDPLFQRGPRKEPLSARDRLRRDIYVVSKTAGRVSSAAFGPELRAEYDALEWRLNASIARAQRNERRRFLENVYGALTDHQLDRLSAAENALRIGAPANGVDGSPGNSSTLIGGRMVSWFDARLLLDPRIEVRGEVPAKVHELRAAVLAEAPNVLTAAPGVAALVENYEARWANEKRRIDRLKLSDSDPTVEDVEDAQAELTSELLDKSSSLWSVQLQQQIATILGDATSPELAALWIAATDRMLHPGLYRRWDRIDEEFDEAIERVGSAAAPDEDLIVALRTLRAQYIAETDGLERRLLAGSRATRSLYGFVFLNGTEKDREAYHDFERLLQSAIERRDWYRRAIADLVQMERE